MQNHPEIYVLIATAGGRPDLLRRTLEGLCRIPRPSTFAGVLVIVNARESGVEDVVPEFATSLNAQHVHVRRSNKSAALNVGLEQLPSEALVVFLDDDIRPGDDLLIAYTRVAARYGIGHYFGGPTGADYEQQPPAWLVSLLPASARGWAWDGPPDAVGNASFLGFNWAAFAGDLRAAGGFDPQLGPGSGLVPMGDETDMQLRLAARGARAIYVPDARVWHHVPADRCASTWAVDRAHNRGLARGILSRRGAGSAPSARGRVARRVKAICWAAVASVAPGKLGFVARFWSRYHAGVLRGWDVKLLPAPSTSLPPPAGCVELSLTPVP